MRQLIYISTTQGDHADGELEAILSSARSRNRADGISGLLLFNGLRFLQVLEGSATAIERTYRRIAEDRRHRSIVVLGDRTIESPEFGDWSMAFERSDNSAEFAALAEQIETALIAATPTTTALFRNFAKAA
ncbi:BLUF domain-containing protein [Pacificimonas sp. WHA3]|uniref:BLUF domain-containing protein n=1 Tax=Pacificimonas pallii TaxID=2827236 RepID=A0ABS6SIC0_9SPHN|nr:BLUF domain-containing protein [Pacificimonas pallii]MBV7257671.1 BLUF domain-containing protein [Pacificimonas pallii]